MKIETKVETEYVLPAKKLFLRFYKEGTYEMFWIRMDNIDTRRIPDQLW